MTFPALAELPHTFVLRQPNVDTAVPRDEALRRLAPWHLMQVKALSFSPTALRTAEQVHGAGIAVVDSRSPALTPAVDGLISRDGSVMLGIYVADCAAVYLSDPVTGAFGLVHAGKKGTELGIVPAAIEAMKAEFGSETGDVIVQISPCIRPPDYEVDFAASIRQQCLDAGIAHSHLHDCGLNTASDLQRFYSYRIERGLTGRMLALLGSQCQD